MNAVIEIPIDMEEAFDILAAHIRTSAPDPAVHRRFVRMSVASRRAHADTIRMPSIRR